MGLGGSREKVKLPFRFEGQRRNFGTDRWNGPRSWSKCSETWSYQTGKVGSESDGVLET